jgi:hypothetical protein
MEKDVLFLRSFTDFDNVARVLHICGQKLSESGRRKLEYRRILKISRMTPTNTKRDLSFFKEHHHF